jgi:Secretion system C-terminal sorting domain
MKVFSLKKNQQSVLTHTHTVIFNTNCVKNIFHFLAFILLFIPMKSNTQNAPNVEWDFTSPSTMPRGAGDDNWALTSIPFKDGNFIIVGFTDQLVNNQTSGLRHPSLFKLTPDRGGRIVWEVAPTIVPSYASMPVANAGIGGFLDGIPLTNATGLQEHVLVAGYYRKDNGIGNGLGTPLVAKVNYFTGKIEYCNELLFPSNFKHVDINKLVWAYDVSTKKYSAFGCGRAAEYGKDWKPMVCKIDAANGTLDKSWGSGKGYVTFSIKGFPDTGCRMYDFIQRKDFGFAIAGAVMTGKKDYGCNSSEVKDAYVVGLSNAGLVEWEQSFSEKDLEKQGVYIDDNAKNELPLCPQIKSVEDTENEIAFSIKETSTAGEFAVVCRFDYVDVPYCVLTGGCIPFTAQTSDGYLECDLAMIKFKIDTKSKSVVFKYGLDAGRIAGLDFWNPMIRLNSSDDYLILGAAAEQTNNVATGKVLGSVIKLTDEPQNNAFKFKWRKDFAGAANLFCPFGLSVTNDDGLIICGNNELNGDDYEVIKLGNSCQASTSFDIGNTEITNNTLWNSNKSVKGIVRVKTGATLTIQNCTIRFANSYLTNDYQDLANGKGFPTKIIVEVGAFLVIDNATLTGMDACKKEAMWEGIEVLGKPTAASYSWNQGNLKMINNAQISNSYYGISAGSRYYNQAGRSTATGNDGGGIIVCDNPTGSTSAHFKNNRFSVWFAPVTSVHTSNQCKFNNTNFICDMPLLDANYVSAGGLGLGSKSMLSSWSRNNFNIQNCTFKSLKGYPFENQGNAVANFDSKMSLVNCTFDNFENGIYAAYGSGMTRPTDVSDCTFRNVAHGVYLLDGALHRVQNSTFSDIPVGGGTSSYTSGICSFGSKITNFKNNTFSAVSNTISSYGILTDESGDDASLFKGNTFKNINFGFQSQNNNAGLQLRCNTHLNNDLAWSINPQSQNPGWFSEQGICGDDKNQPANVFSDDHSLICHINSSIDFQYNHRDISEEIPSLSTFQAKLVNCKNQSNENTCEEVIPCINCAKTIQQQAASSATLWERQVIEADLMRYLINNPESEKELSFDDAISSLSLNNKAELAFAIALDKGDYTKADNFLVAMEQKDENSLATKQIYTMMLSLQKENKNILQLNKEQLSSLESIAIGETAAKYKAQAILEVNSNIIFDQTIEKWDTKPDQNRIVKNKILTQNWFSFLPNPADDKISIILSENTESLPSVISVYNTAGVLVLQSNLTSNTVSSIIDISTLNDGVYLISIQNKNGRNTQKLVVQR